MFQTPSYRTCEAQEWRKEITETCALLDAIISVMHTPLYNAAVIARKKLMAVTAMPGYNELYYWPSIFQGTHVMVNRETLYHQHAHSKPGWLDMLVTCGGTRGRGLLSLRTLGASVPYDSGTVALINARVVSHGVAPVGPDRIAYSWKMNRGVYEYCHQFPKYDWAVLGADEDGHREG